MGAARSKVRSGVEVLADVAGDGGDVRRQGVYQVRLRMWLNRSDPVRWTEPFGFVDRAKLEDDGATLVTEVRIDRHTLVNGLFYGVDGMRVGGMRRLQIAPHLAYGDRGVPGIVPPGAVITAEITVLDEGTNRA